MTHVLLLILVASLEAAPSTAGDATYRYVRWVGRETLSIQAPTNGSSRGQVIIGDDAFFQTPFCESDSDFFCFFSSQLAFAVPKHLSNVARKWTVRDITFEIVEKDVSVSIFGRRHIGLIVVKTPAEATNVGQKTGKPTYFLYSARDGVVGFSYEYGQPTYWLEGEVGFGAQTPR